MRFKESEQAELKRSTAEINELLCELFHRVHFIEKWGRGIKLILGKEPRAGFRELGRKFIAVFPRQTERVGERITGNQAKIIKFMMEDPLISAQALAAKIGISSRKIEENIAKLRKKGLIKRKGSARSGRWEVSK